MKFELPRPLLFFISKNDAMVFRGSTKEKRRKIVMELSRFVAYIFLALIILISVYTDIMYYKVLNKIVYPGILLGILVSTLFYGWRGMGFSLVGIFLTIGILFFFYALGFLGAGDVKLFAVVGGFLGFQETFWILLYSFLAGGGIGLIVLLMRKNGKERFKKLWIYLKISFYGMKLSQYEGGKRDEKGIFWFTYSIAAGFGIYLLKVYWF
jgi:prepilin peptidase CpaA